MIDIPFQDYTTYDVPGEYHVRSEGNWEGWLILQNPVTQDDGSIVGVIEKSVKAYDEFPAEQTTYDVRLLPKIEEAVPEGGVVEMGVTDSASAGEHLQ